MKNTVQCIVERIDRQAIDAQLASIVKQEKLLRQSEDALGKSRDATPLLDRLNPFKTTDGEIEIRQHKSEIAEILDQISEINEQIVKTVRDAVASEPKAQLAISLSQLSWLFEQMESGMRDISVMERETVSKCREIDLTQFEIGGLEPVQEALHNCQSSLDQLTNQLREQFGVESGVHSEQSLIDATLNELR